MSYCNISITKCRIKLVMALRKKPQPHRQQQPRRRSRRRDNAMLVKASSCRRQAGFIYEESGVAAVEFALVAPVLLLIALAAILFALALNNFIVVTNASAVGASNLVLSRGAATPYSDTIASVRRAAQSLAQGSLTIALSVDGVSCGDDTTCTTALNAASGRPANVAVSYPCRLAVLNIDFAPGGCVLRQSTAGRVQ